MRNHLSPWLLLCALATRSSAKAAGVAGVLNNAGQASVLQSSANLPDQGTYLITNVASGQSLTYTAVGNHIAPGSGSGSPFTITHYGASTSWIRLAVGNKNKCVSSQWGGSYDHAAVMYSCAVSKGGSTTKGNTLEPTKQWWLMVPVGVDLSPAGHVISNQMLVKAQEISVNTREDSIAAGTSKNAFKPNGNSKRNERVSESAESRLERRSKKHRKHKHKHGKTKHKGTKSKGGKKPKAKSGSGQKFFIIPTDHLIDMHTMALTGNTLKTVGNTISMALEIFSPTDANQQWYVTKC